MKKIILAILLLFLPLLCFAETISLKSGKTFEAEILERSNEYLQVDFEGVALTFFWDEIEAIDGEKITKPSLSEEKEEQVPKITKHYVSNIDEFTLETYRNLAEKYKYDGNNEIVLKQGIIFKPRDIVVREGVVFMLFKGDTTEEKKYETGLAIPLSEVKSINGNLVE